MLLPSLPEARDRGGGLSYNILLVGVGGQGVLLASSVLGNAAMEDGLNVVMSEVHGMAQRGGSVTATVRIGSDAKSPLIPRGGADVLIGFEPAETYRHLHFAHRSTFVVTNMHPIIPIQVSMGLEGYPEVDTILGAARELNDHLLPIDADGLAAESGNRMAAGAVLVGAVCALDRFPISRESVHRALAARVPERHAEANAKAFDKGFEVARGAFPR